MIVVIVQRFGPFTQVGLDSESRANGRSHQTNSSRIPRLRTFPRSTVKITRLIIIQSNRNP